MKHTRPQSIINHKLLSYIKYKKPTISEFNIEYPDPQIINILRKHDINKIDNNNIEPTHE